MFLLVLVSCLSGLVGADEVPKPNARRSTDTLVIGKVTNNPKKHYARLMPFAAYLKDHLSDLGITRTEIRLTRTVSEMVQLLAEGKVDLVSDTAYGAVTYMDRVDAEPLLLKWKKKVGEYRSLIVVRKDSGIDSLADLRGHVIAFEDPDSTSAYLVAYAALLQSNIDLNYLVSPRALPPQNTLGYVFSQSEQNTAAWVYKGLVTAGAISDLDWNKKNHVTSRQRKAMKVLYTSEPIPRAIELVRSDLPSEIKERIYAVLLGMQDDPGADYVRKKNQQTSRYEKIDAEVLAGLQKVREMAELVNRER